MDENFELSQINQLSQLKLLSIYDIFKNPLYKGKSLIMTDSHGSWIVYDNGSKLKRTNNAVGLVSIESYWLIISTEQITYYMTNGHTFCLLYKDNAFMISTDNKMVKYENFIWK